MLHLLCREDGLNSNSSAAGIGSDWFEGALVRPDIVLSDVARAINSSNVPKVCLFLPSALCAHYSMLRAPKHLPNAVGHCGSQLRQHCQL